MMTLPHPQERFFQTVNLQIETHLSDSSLTVNRLLRLVGMSRTDLHRKLHLCVAMSATAYIRHVRLTRAAELLRKQPGWCVDSIAVEVGFNNLGYFYRKFKEKFGCCPGKWRAGVGKIETCV